MSETAKQALSPLEYQEFEALGLKNIAAHGVIEPDARRATYFSFSRMPEPLPSDIHMRLTLLAPICIRHSATCARGKWVRLRGLPEIVLRH